MEIASHFYKLISLKPDGSPDRFLGCCSPVGPDGGMLTCRHVVEACPDGALGIYDNERACFVRIAQAPVICRTPETDMAFLPNALGRPKPEFFPILTPRALQIGEDVYSYGHFMIGGAQAEIEAGYFSGKIVNFFRSADPARAMLTLPFTAIEGLSGSPVLTYHHGVKLVGLVTGNRASRIMAHEVMEFEDDRVQLRETINRIVEFGTAMHCAAIVEFLDTLPTAGHSVRESE